MDRFCDTLRAVHSAVLQGKLTIYSLWLLCKFLFYRMFICIHRGPSFNFLHQNRDIDVAEFHIQFLIRVLFDLNILHSTIVSKYNIIFSEITFPSILCLEVLLSKF